MNYNKFVSMITPFINARGNSIMFPPESLETTINIAIQQIYNEYRWWWLITDETINEFNVLWDVYVWQLETPVKYLISCSKWSQELNPCSSKQDLTNTSYMVKWTSLIVRDNEEHVVTFLKDYNFINYTSEWTTKIPLPDKLIPALYYLVLSQLDLVDVQQLQWQPSANFSKYQYEINNAKLDDTQFSQTLTSNNSM